jgi:GNAT superfamily N-acetyltransferase
MSMAETNAAMIVRQCHDGEFDALLRIINSAADVYRGAIPDDCWHEPYMSPQHLRDEIASGVSFVGADIDGALAGVMGIQRVRNVELIRHAYVLPEYQGHGVGSTLIAHLKSQAHRQILVGTWSAATWAIRFYERHEFRLVPESDKAVLLQTYWSIPERQVDPSVVLALPPLTAPEVALLLQEAADVAV